VVARVREWCLDHGRPLQDPNTPESTGQGSFILLERPVELESDDGQIAAGGEEGRGEGDGRGTDEGSEEARPGAGKEGGLSPAAGSGSAVGADLEAVPPGWTGGGSPSPAPSTTSAVTFNNTGMTVQGPLHQAGGDIYVGSAHATGGSAAIYRGSSHATGGSTAIVDAARRRGADADAAERLEGPGPRPGSSSPRQRAGGPFPDQRAGGSSPGQRAEDTSPGLRTGDPSPRQRAEGLSPGQRAEDTSPGQRAEDPSPRLRASGSSSRLALLKALRALSDEALEEVIGLLEPPADRIPASSTTRVTRTLELVAYCQQLEGDGLATLHRAIEVVAPDVLSETA
jgi:hypothetical protein